MKLRNSEIAQILQEIGEYLAMDNIPFKPQAYRRAAQTIRDLGEELGNTYESGGLKALKEIPGIGQAIAEKIEELLKTGKLKYYEKLKKDTPVDLSALSGIEGLGPQRVKALYDELGVKTVADLEKAAKSGKVRGLDGFGEKSEKNILKGIEFYHSHGQRSTLDKVMPIAQEFEERLRGLKEVDKVTVAGSFRRRKETIGDIDILVVSKKPDSVMDFFVNQDEVERVLAKGSTKSSVLLKTGIDVDLRVVEAKSYGAALNYFTGSKDHNVALRTIAQKRGLKLNEYGLFKGDKQIAGKTEKEIYEKLDLEYIEPEMRENTGEIEASASGRLPKLVEYSDIKGDMQVQTSWTDGRNSIEEMADEAIKVGLEYILITDHTQSLAMTKGFTPNRIKEQIEEIDKLNKEYKGKIRILKGSECDILKDGSLDLPDETLKELDVVGVSIHSYFNLSKKAQTERVKKAMENPHADIFFHPSARRIGRRPPIEIDMDQIIKEAKKTGTIMEIDGHPERLDLQDEYIRQCKEAGVKMSISSDAHSVKGLKYLKTGVSQARRGWAEREDIINAWPVDKMLSFLKDAK